MPKAVDGYKPSAGKRQESDLSHQAQATQTHGATSTRRLNPLFVEWLMGLPIGWTDCDAAEMQSFPSWRATHSAVLLRVLTHEAERQSNT